MEYDPFLRFHGKINGETSRIIEILVSLFIESFNPLFSKI